MTTLKGGVVMLERFTDSNITIKQNSNDNVAEKNRKRHEAIREHFEKHTIVPKNNFINHIKENMEIPNKDVMVDKINNIDFSKANPRNNILMNELAFAGESVTEGFLDVFNIEVNNAVDRYQKQTHIIEQKLDDESSRAFIGQFDKSRLKRKTDFFDSVEKLKERVEEKSNELKVNRKQSKSQEQTLSIKREKE